MKAMLLARALAAFWALSEGVQLPEEGRRLVSALGGRGAAPSKATSLLQSLDEFVDADDTTGDEEFETAESGSAAAQEASTEGAQEQEEVAATVDTASHTVEEGAHQEKSEAADQSSAAGKSEVQGATKTKKKKRAGLFSLVKAQADILDMNKRMDKLKWNQENAANKTGRCRYKKEYYARKVAEIRAERDFRRKSKGKHLVMNETLAKARRARGNFSMAGLWIITDEPFTKQDHEREKFQRSIRRITSQTENITQLEEGVAKYTELEQMYGARTAFYEDQIAELNATLQAALSLRDEAKHNLKPKRRRAKEQPVV